MSTHLPGFQSFLKFFALFCKSQISHQQHKGYKLPFGIWFHCMIFTCLFERNLVMQEFTKYLNDFLGH